MSIDKNLVCRCCGDDDSDLQACAICESMFCDDCSRWCCDEDDEDSGDYFCLSCIAAGQ